MKIQSLTQSISESLRAVAESKTILNNDMMQDAILKEENDRRHVVMISPLVQLLIDLPSN